MATSLKNLSSYNPSLIPSGKNKSIGIIVSEWNEEITSALLHGAIDTLVRHHVPEENIHIVYVPGSFELPFGALDLLNKQKLDAVICLGCIIQGETRHFDFISDAVANGVMNLGIKFNIPVIFGVLTTNTLEQAQERSGGKHGNKGVEAGVTALKMINL